MLNRSLEQRGRQYSQIYGIPIDFDTHLGHGQDGVVWQSGDRTAVKALERLESFAEPE
jgi:hypothetical protein